MQSNCVKCGNTLSDGAAFCSGCGVSISETNESAPQVKPSSPSAVEAPPLSKVPSDSDLSQLPPRRASSKNIWSILLDGSGKSSRGLYALVLLPILAIKWILYALSLAQESVILDLIFILYWIPATYVGFVAIIRRFHDMGKSGWWCLVIFVPLVNAGTLIALMCISGKRIEGEEVACPECHLLVPHHLGTCTWRNPLLRQ
jgi:uncharacterized membrane protein YhaH (DUF805 family)